jgi:hypothetical protein
VSIDWTEVAAVAESISGLAIAASLLLVVLQLRGQRSEQFVSGSGDMFAVWDTDDFQRAVQWVLYDLDNRSWRAFITAHRGQYGERAFYRVGGYYNRVGYLATHNLLGGLDQLLLDTVSPQAIRVWQKIEPLVLEARLIDNSMLFQDFEKMLPECFECYIPGAVARSRASAITRSARH